MAKNSKALKTIQRFSTKTYYVFKRILQKLWEAIHSIWDRPLIVGALLLIAAVFLANLMIQHIFKSYTNCAYLLITNLGAPSFFCDGYDVTVLGSSVFKIPGLSGIMNPPLELVREVTVWSIVFFFACLSIYATYMINNLKSVVKLLTFNKEQWKSFLASLRTWLLIFVGLCLLFYFIAMR